MNETIQNDANLFSLAKEAGLEFDRVARNFKPRPIIGLVGEIYLRNNRFSNNHLITKLEALGAEVKLATFGEWINYTSLTFKLDSIYKRNWKGIIKAIFQGYIQHHDETKMINRFRKYLSIDHESPVLQVVRLAGPYLPIDLRGEALLSIGKAIDFANQGASGIINCMPFNCMPGTIVTSLSRKISQDLGDMPWLNISYEGLQDTGEETRLDAFMDQVKNKYRSKAIETVQTN
jgi:predicted nucleotide-binding protein (sugar kinase/HSP70/actin superfamily)